VRREGVGELAGQPGRLRLNERRVQRRAACLEPITQKNHEWAQIRPGAGRGHLIKCRLDAEILNPAASKGSLDHAGLVMVDVTERACGAPGKLGFSEIGKRRLVLTERAECDTW